MTKIDKEIQVDMFDSEIVLVEIEEHKRKKKIFDGLV